MTRLIGILLFSLIGAYGFAGKVTVNTPNAPRLPGRSSQAIKVDNTVYISTQFPLDNKTDEVLQASPKEQAQQLFSNLEAVMNAAGGTLEDIAMIDISVTKPEYLAVINSVIAERFINYPARTVRIVASIYKNSPFSISAIAQMS